MDETRRVVPAVATRDKTLHAALSLSEYARSPPPGDPAVTWPVVARRDLRELRADNSFLYLGAFLALLGGGAAYVATATPGVATLAGTMSLLVTFAVPLVATTLVHEQIPREVASGRSRLTLSLPHTRRAYVVGVGASGLAATLLVLAVAVLTALAVYLVRGGPLALPALAVTLAVAVLYAAAFVGGTLALTAASGSTTVGVVLGYGFVVVSFVWPGVVAAGTAILAGELGVSVSGGTADAVVQLSPLYAWQNAMAAVDVNSGALTGSPWRGLLVLLAWAVGGTLLAARRFDAIDL